MSEPPNALGDAFDIFSAARERPSAPFIISPAGVVSFDALARATAAQLTHLQQSGIVARQLAPVAFRAANDLPSLALLLALIVQQVPALLLHPRWTAQETTAALAAAAGTPWQARLSAPTPALLETTELAVPATGAVPPDPEAILAIIHTSGSSGAPRGVMLSRRAFYAAARASALNLGWQQDDRWLLSLPIAHVAGLSIVLRCLAARRPMIWPSLLEGHTTVEQLLSAAQHCQATLMSLVPTQLVRLLALGAPRPAKLRAVLLGGAAATTTLVAQGRRAGWPLLTTYGSTETCSQITTQALDDPATAGCGKPLSGVELRVDKTRIFVRSKTLLSGYYPDEEAPLDDQGWLPMPDCGVIDSDGTLHVLGRADHVIISGGENVFPDEVEAALTAHPEVRAACVFALDDLEFGARICAAIVPTTTALPETLPHFLACRLAPFKRPRRIAVLEHLVTSANGKVDRPGTQARALAHLVNVEYPQQPLPTAAGPAPK